MLRSRDLATTLTLAIVGLSGTVVLGLLGMAALYAEAIATLAGGLASLFGTDVYFDGAWVVVTNSRGPSLLAPSLHITPLFLYYNLPVIVAVTGATPNIGWRNRIFSVCITFVGLSLAQAVLLVGFSLVDTPTNRDYVQVHASYAAWSSIGPLLLAAWWFWTRWLPPWRHQIG